MNWYPSPEKMKMSTTNIIGAFEAGALDLDGTTKIESTPFCHIFRDHGQNALRYRQITSLKTPTMTRNKNLQEWDMKNRESYSPEQAVIGKRRNSNNETRTPQSKTSLRWSCRGIYNQRPSSNPSTVRSENKGHRTGPAPAYLKN